ncbi:hypothetical protein MLD38_035711 [Melastoma candidum]|uniref:Uncharacterized protein n=1 Tax=Melastoma candidum TaxID=119954 RepID=A0ACB9LJA5_9MYRT|nr:hypothetical protein MLD38_035711 [Melastoma candidum]
MSGIPTDGPAHRGGGRDRWEHDVFVSFRGTDTRAGFVSHLHHAFRVASVAAFVDYQLERGEIISPSLRKAIETSRMAVVVFSPNYASSSWCLDELVAIMECREKRGQLVRPVFLHIEPGEVRHQTGIFGDAMRVHEEDRKEDPAKVRRWRDALTQTANLSGWNLGDGVESELIQRIVEEVSSKLRRPYFDVAKHPVWLDPHVETVMLRIRMDDMPEDAHLLGICGVGGIGKTTVAKAVYNRIADEYDGSSFLANVREVARQHGVVKLQESLLRDILGDSKLKVGYIQTGVSMMRDKLDGKRVLLVLDDVDRSNQVNDLLGERNWLGLGSGIIITSRSAEVLADVGVADVYKINQLNHDDSLELFSWNAFKKPHPNPDYQFLSSFFVTHAMGLPLSLIILGSFLHSKSVFEWKQASDRLKASVSGNMDLIIQFCFQGLEAHERAIFLDIACFFNGEDKNDVIKLLNRCNFYPDSGLEILVQKSLIRIEFNKIWMHDLLQEAGREIVRQESPANPGRRSRLWHPEDILQVFQENSGTNLVEGIKLDMVESEMVFMLSRARGQMKRLRLVMVRDVHISGCPEYLSNDLRLPDVHGNESSGPSEIPRPGVVTIPNTTLDTVECSGILENQRRTAWACQCPISVKTLLGKRLKVFSAFKRVSIEAVSDMLGKIFCFRVYGRRKGCTKGSSFTEAKIFSAMELLRATENFSDHSRIGLGSFGSVHYGVLDDGRRVAIKRAAMRPGERFKDPAFINEVSILSCVRHKNIVRLLGFMETTNESALVLKYMMNGSLSYQLHFKRSPEIMSWMARIRVATDAARGIHYLHDGDWAYLPIIHCDVKASNILLDFDWTAKVSDFGLAKLSCLGGDELEDSSHLVGTYGYIDPDHYFGRQLSSASDVYGFGIVLLELLTGRKPVDRDEAGDIYHITDLMVPLITRGDFDAALDPNMPKPTEIEMASIGDMAYLAVECVSITPKDRPQMSQVLSHLTRALDRLSGNETNHADHNDDIVEEEEEEYAEEEEEYIEEPTLELVQGVRSLDSLKEVSDEAALCTKCDVEVHAANKLASKHQRLLLHPNPSSLPICDICQEKPAFIFCVEDRALFCKDCDEPIHSGNSLATNHRRFLATGIKVAQGSNPAPKAEKEDEPPSRGSPPQTSTRWSQQQQPLPQQHLSSFSSPWGATDDLLQLPDFGYTEKEQLEFGLGELDWFDDMSLFPHEEVSSGGAAAEVPQRPISPPAIGISSRMSKPSMPLKKQRTGFVPDMPYKKQKTAFLQDVDEFFTVPDLG